MRGVRVVSVGYSDLTTAVPGDAIVRVYADVTLWHRTGDLHRLTVENGQVLDDAVSRTSHQYLTGMAAFAEDGDGW